MADDIPEAESLRLKGNKAFSAKNWERALELYQRSVQCAGGDSAKTYSNIAATYCRLFRYEEASEAAEQATTLDPSWAKGWWRRGEVAEYRKFFEEAFGYYSKAVELEPNEAAFAESLKKLNKRLGVVEIDPKGRAVLPHINAVRPSEPKQPASVVAWRKFVTRYGNPVTTNIDVSYFNHQATVPTSQQYLEKGLMSWVIGLKQAVAELAMAVNPEARSQYRAIQQQNCPMEQKEIQTIRLLGVSLDGAMPTHLLASGFAHLGGLHIVLETPGTFGNELLFCTQPPFLSKFPAFQNMALIYSIEAASCEMVKRFGKKMRTSGAVLAATSMFYANLSGSSGKLNRGVAASAETCVRYIKAQLLAGKTWNYGLRMYASLQYRGTILYAALIRLNGMVAEAYKWEKWAREFMDLADREFKVTRERTFEEKGSGFRQTFRIGMLMSELQSLSVLRGNEINGPYSMEMALDICTDIIKRASKMEPAPARMEGGSYDEFFRIQDDVAFRRKPLALAHSVIASHLNTLRAIFSPAEFTQIAAHHGLIDDNQDDKVDPFALIAKHYKLAAQAEIPDADQGAVYWWGYAACAAQATPESGFTLGDLRRAIANAEEAELERDVDLFGPNQDRGGSFETIAKLTAEHYKAEHDSMVLGQVQLVRPSKNTSFLRIGDHVICSDFAAYERQSHDFYTTKSKHRMDERMARTEGDETMLQLT